MSETKSENGYEEGEEDDEDIDKTVVNPFSKLESKMKVLTDVNDTDSDDNEENDDDDDDDDDDEERYDDADEDNEMDEDENEVDDDEDDDNEEEDDDEDDDDDGGGNSEKTFFPQEEDDDNDDDDDDDKKSKEEDDDGSSDTLLKSYILEQKSYMKLFHPECSSISFDEVKAMSVVIRDSSGIVIDPLHRTIPILTKYEKARIIGLRTYHLDDGDEPYISDVRLIAGMSNSDIAALELKMKLLPYIIRRPFPDGKFEYWKLCDLEMFY